MNRNSQGSPQPNRIDLWVTRRWPKFLIVVGLLLFWLACLDSAHLPIEALFVGPALMASGIIMEEWNSRDLG
ncbi:MAG TPA: hypothetical protein VLY04_21050 [Bryobacteraceae bacterium]|nr:hypothetical protein [Bryobacteraceae bacterium]